MSGTVPHIRALHITRLKPNTLLNIRDNRNKPMANITVTISSGGQIFKSVTSSKGYLQGYSIPSIISLLTINVEGIIPLVQKFILTNKIFLEDPDSAVIIKIHDDDENPIENAEVTVSSVIESKTELTNIEGIVEMGLTNDFQNTIVIKKKGFKDFSFNIPVFTRVNYNDMAFIAIPVINLKVDIAEL